MNTENYEELKQQLDEYKQEKERIRKLVGQIGSRKGSKYHKIVNQIFLLTVLLIFILAFIFNIIPKDFSLELLLLFATIKIIWMIHDQQKINHFQFWILSSIELKVNTLEKKINKALRD